jgi:hypothetical protein
MLKGSQLNYQYRQQRLLKYRMNMIVGNRKHPTLSCRYMTGNRLKVVLLLRIGKLANNGLHNSYTSQNKTRVIK